ncbi:MAG: protein kinase [Planctomycetota bacterium]
MLEPGERLGGFEVLEVLGEGGMGRVYRARGPAGEVVALKVISAALAGDPGARERFRIESEVLSDLRQPRIVAARTGLERTGDLLHYAMEWVEGEDLALRLEREGRQPLEPALGLASDVLEALVYAHARDVLHRDVKPANVLVDRAGRAKLSDFGLARALDATRVTRPGSVLGTPAYMAPELAEGGEASVASEVYAVGALLHELLAGEPPFRGESALAVLHQHLNATPPPLEGVPARVQAIVARALAKRPGERYPSATAMRDDLIAARASLGSGAGDGTGSTPAAQQAALAEAVTRLEGPPAATPASLVEAETRDLTPVALAETRTRELAAAPGSQALATASGIAAPELESQAATSAPSTDPYPEGSAEGGRLALAIAALLVAGFLGLLLAGDGAQSARPPGASPHPSAGPGAGPGAGPSGTDPSPSATTKLGPQPGPAASPSPSKSPDLAQRPSPAGSASPSASDVDPPLPGVARVRVLLRGGESFEAELVAIDLRGGVLVTRAGGRERRDPLATVESYEKLSE